MAHAPRPLISYIGTSWSARSALSAPRKALDHGQRAGVRSTSFPDLLTRPYNLRRTLFGGEHDAKYNNAALPGDLGNFICPKVMSRHVLEAHLTSNYAHRPRHPGVIVDSLYQAFYPLRVGMESFGVISPR